MPKATQVNWQPISQMPLIAGMIKGSLDDTREHLGTLTKARDRPHVLDDATIDRIEQVHTEQMEKQNQQLRIVTTDVLALAGELRKGTIERVLGMSDIELGIQALLASRPSGRR
jgi:hypothetical protein